MDTIQTPGLSWHEREGGDSWTARHTGDTNVDIFHHNGVFSWQLWREDMPEELLDAMAGDEGTLHMAMLRAAEAYARLMAVDGRSQGR